MECEIYEMERGSRDNEFFERQHNFTFFNITFGLEMFLIQYSYNLHIQDYFNCHSVEKNFPAIYADQA